MDPLIWQALAFSVFAILSVALSAWWLYASPVAGAGASPAPISGRVSPRLAAALAVLLGLSAAQMVAGGLWDASMHIRTGIVPGGSDFLWPPHIMIYSAFLLSFVVAVTASAVLVVPAWRAGLRDPRRWFRLNPYLGAVALASLYALLSVPGDALWHELFGVDLTAWSPPHLLIAAMMSAVILSATGLLAQARVAGRARIASDIGIIVLAGLALSVLYMVGVLEWEIFRGRPAPLVAARPLWLYPAVGGSAAFFACMLAKCLVRMRWAATGTAALFYTVRLAITVALALSDNVVPYPPLWFILGAVLLDAVATERIRSGFLRHAAAAAAFTAGFAVLALPLLALRGGLPPLSAADYLAAVAATFGASLALAPAAQWTGQRLAGREMLVPSYRRVI